MKILITNDDGILAEGLWTLARELKNVAQVVVVAPDREQSAVGTAVTLAQPIRARKTTPLVPGVEAWAVEGTPSDTVILALEKLVKNEVGLVISGINQGLNLGNDVLISGTVGAALQGYLRGVPSFAISTALMDSDHLDDVAWTTAKLAQKIMANGAHGNVFLNINLPDLPLHEVKGIKITSLAPQSHTEAVNEGHDGKRHYYWLVRRKVDKARDKNTDMGAIDEGHISITPLHTYRDHESTPILTESFCTELFHELRRD